MRVALVFDRTRQDTSGQYFERALASLGVSVKHFWLRDAETIPQDFDWYLRIDHGDYVRDLPRHLRPSAFYMIDTHLRRPLHQMRRVASHYDVLFCAQREALRTFLRAVWVPAACDVALHGAGEAARGAYMYDVGFVGTEGGIPRKFYLQALRERYPNSYIGWAPHTKIGEMYRASRLVFNFAINNDINMRVFEALGAGRCLLTNAIHGNGFEELFRDREHLVVYHSPQELWQLLDYYLTHDDERERIAQEGHVLVRAQHTYRHRAETMLNVLNQRLGLQRDAPSTRELVSPMQQEPSLR